MNTLSRENIEQQLLYYSKESLKHILLSSKCGIPLTTNDFRTKNIPNFDISIFKKNSPLLCIYKKANPKLINENNSYRWDDSTFKKEININSNAFMTLSIIELISYYDLFRHNDTKLYSTGRIYNMLAKKQLDFYSSHLRNIEGVFVDKKDCSDNLRDNLVFEDKDKKFKFSDQALLMAAFYKISLLPDNKDSEAYKTFALDILKMFIEYKNELYTLSFEELNKLCLAINIFYDYSDHPEAKTILIDLCDLLMEKWNEKALNNIEYSVEYNCMMYINLHLAYKKTNLIMLKDFLDDLYIDLEKLYDNDKGIFIKKTDKKDIDFSCQEIMMYVLCMTVHSKVYDYDNLSILSNVFKRQLINSGIVLCWPDAPSLDNAERYSNFSLKTEDMLEDHHFRLPTIPTPESSELAPILIKNVQYNIKKEVFSAGKTTFDSTKNMHLLFLVIYLLKDGIPSNKELTENIVAKEDEAPVNLNISELEERVEKTE
jgi:hypothetical protein